MRERIDLTGKQYTRWTVLRYSHTDKTRTSHWDCECKCGVRRKVSGSNLSSGKSKSCGCILSEKTIARCRIHGLIGHPVYKVWKSMRERCKNPKRKDYPRYGGRGISIAPEWNDPAVFVRDMISGYSPELTIERIDNNKGYSKQNCCWATRIEQGGNTCRNKHIDTPWGRLTVSEAARRSGIASKTIWSRLSSGWGSYKTVTTTVRKWKRKLT